DKLAGVNDPQQAQFAGETFVVLADRLPPKESAAVCRALRQMMARPAVGFGAGGAREAFATAAGRLSADDAAREIPVFLKELIASRDVASTLAYAEALAAQGERLSPEQAARAAADVLDKLKRVADRAPPVVVG